MIHDDRLVCIVDDDISVRESIASLTLSVGLRTELFSSAKQYLSSPRATSPACLVLDVDLPDLTGLQLQDELRHAGVRVPIVFVTGYGDIPMSVRALKAGAVDFFTKPFDPDQLLAAIHAGIVMGEQAAASAEQPSRLVQIDEASRRGTTTAKAFAEIVGESSLLTQVLSQVLTVARTESTVLIHGETGTGKELIARAIHNASDRKCGPFIKINCGAIPAGLLESELMGHEKGAFTGAIARRIGRFELAQDGTIFLDEIGEMAADLQPKLLRLLQEREFERVGGSRTIRTNARVVAATNRDLSAMVKARTFREDLYYRLNVFPVTLPPLRDRRDDIPLLAEHFVRRVAARLKKDVRTISSTGTAHLMRYGWPGNIRELENVLERAVILAGGPTLDIPPLNSVACPEDKATQRDDLAAVNKAHILAVLDATRGIVAGPDGAAVRLGVKRSTLNYRMKKLGILRESRQARHHYVAAVEPAAE